MGVLALVMLVAACLRVLDTFHDVYEGTSPAGRLPMISPWAASSTNPHPYLARDAVVCAI